MPFVMEYEFVYSEFITRISLIHTKTTYTLFMPFVMEYELPAYTCSKPHMTYMYLETNEFTYMPLEKSTQTFSFP
jgi:hypothetical protein